LTDLGREWTRGTVHQVLVNEKYLGNNVWNHVSFKLKKKRVHNQPEMWIRSDGVFPAIVEQKVFDAAQAIIRARSIKLSDEEMLSALQALLERQGTISGIVIDETEGMPSSSAYRSRFGSLLRAYQLVGYRPHRDYDYVEINRSLREMYPEVVGGVVESLRRCGSSVDLDDLELLRVNSEFSVSVVVARCTQTQAGSYRWHIRFDVGLLPDITIVVRMSANNRDPLDFYLLPSIDLKSDKLRLAEDNGLGIDAYRFDDLEEFYELVRPTPIKEAA
jgi:hypothetical protein